MRIPRYHSRSLMQVLPSAASALGQQGFANTLEFPPLSQAAVVVVDGLGYLQLIEAIAHAPLLAGAARAQQPVDAAFPTTTPAGLATLTLGMPPGTHGFVGATFELPDFDVVLNPLRWDGDPPPMAVQPEPNLFSRMRLEVRSHGPKSYALSGMTRTLLHSAVPCDYDAFDPRIIDSAPGRLDYVYLPQLDKVGHAAGPNTPPWNACIADIDAAVRTMCQCLPADAAVIVTSDHGMLAVPDEHRIDVDQLAFATGVRRLGGEPRMRHVYTDDADVVLDRWAGLLGDRATVLSRAAAVEVGLFGEVDEVLADRIGDFIAIAAPGWAMVSSIVDPRVSGLRGLHGGLSDEELLVPALLIRGVA